MSACAHNYVLINVSICFAETFRENLSAKFRRNLGERYAKILKFSPKFRRNFRLNFGETFGENFGETFRRNVSAKRFGEIFAETNTYIN